MKDAHGVRNLAGIISGEGERLFVIVSAMGKTTNGLEKVLDAFYEGRRDDALALLQEITDYHDGIIADLWNSADIPAAIAGLYAELNGIVGHQDPRSREYEAWYDLIVGYGELMSTAIVSGYLASAGIANQWVDMRKVFVTNARHRDANIDMERSSVLLKDVVGTSDADIFIGQGFIGATADGQPTTIGREGSDYSAAVAGYILDADSVAIWKDVEGILNGDPKIFPDAEYIPELTYLDAIELAYNGAQIIHPKTIKPLQNKGIPLHVKCFLDKEKPGSVIKGKIAGEINIPILIIKRDQVLMSIRPHDFSFVLEERFAEIFALLEKYNAKVNLIQSSAVDLSISMDRSRYLDEIVGILNRNDYRASYNTGMELLTIRGYTPAQLAEYGDAPDVYLCQRTRKTLRVVRKNEH